MRSNDKNKLNKKKKTESKIFKLRTCGKIKGRKEREREKKKRKKKKGGKKEKKKEKRRNKKIK